MLKDIKVRNLVPVHHGIDLWRKIETISMRCKIHGCKRDLAKVKVYFDSSSQGLIPVCFLKAVEKWEMEEYPK
jgi:hypothetical protein